MIKTSCTISNNLQTKYDNLMKQFINSIDVNYFGITLDLWTNEYRYTSYLGITCHLITKESNKS